MLDSLLATAPDVPPGPTPGPTPDTAARDARGRFRPGCSGNPAGKRPGTRHAKTILEDAITGEEGHQAARVVIAAAVEGDKVSARWLVGRLDGKPRGRLIEFAVDDNGDMTMGLDAAFRGVMDGTVTLDEAWSLMRWVQAYRDLVPPRRWMDSPLRDAAPEAGPVVEPDMGATAPVETAGDAAPDDQPQPGPVVGMAAQRTGRDAAGPGPGPDPAGPAKHLHFAGDAAAAPPTGNRAMNRAMRRRAAALARAAA